MECTYQWVIINFPERSCGHGHMSLLPYIALWCHHCYQELNWSSLPSLSQNASDVEVDVVGAVIDVSPAHADRLVPLLHRYYFFDIWFSHVWEHSWQR